MDEPEDFYIEGSIKEEAPHKKNFRFKLILLTMLVIAVGGALLLLSGKLANPFQKPPREVEQVTEKALPTAFPRIQTSQKTLQTNLASVVKALSSSKTANASKYQDIQKYIDLAQKEPSLDKSYAFYLKSYEVMQTAYQATKDRQYITAISDLKKILVRYPEYKEGDIVIPK